ncbi:MAG: 50S ribosomal protein L23 [Ardenticatenales bacterium]|jgi:large subunit ribosomal protein L23|nr:50S ribosomal protein L23 [Ardenticatenales bacterium]
MHKYDVLVRPISTEKADVLTARFNQYVFEVARGANKRQIKEAIEGIFQVTVADVRTMVIAGQVKRWGRHLSRSSTWKKAIVTLAPGDVIDLAV